MGVYKVYSIIYGGFKSVQPAYMGVLRLIESIISMHEIPGCTQAAPDKIKV